MISLVLPYPISANRYWGRRIVTPRSGAPFVNDYVTPEARAYRDECGWLAKAAGIRAPLEGRLELTLQLYPHRPLDYAKRVRELGLELWDDGVQCIDLGNAEKVLADALQGIVYADDKQLWREMKERMEPDGEARVVVSVRQLPPRQTPQASLL